MVKEGNVVTVMIAPMGTIYSLHQMGLTEDDHGSLRLKSEFVQEMAEAAARNLGGKLVKTWFDRGHFADIKVEV
jgi:hypothetical protein